MKPDLTIIAGPADGPDAADAMGGAPGMDAAEGTPSDDQCVPLAALAMPDDKEAMQPPEEGDIVSYTVEGKVTKVAGANAYVTPTSINGQPVEADEANEPPSPEEQDAQGMAQLQSQASAMDQPGQQGMGG